METCPKHNYPIEFYHEEDEPEGESGGVELLGVAYGCKKCVQEGREEEGKDALEFTKIDKDNLLNVH